MTIIIIIKITMIFMRIWPATEHTVCLGRECLLSSWSSSKTSSCSRENSPYSLIWIFVKEESSGRVDPSDYENDDFDLKPISFSFQPPPPLSVLPAPLQLEISSSSSSWGPSCLWWTWWTCWWWPKWYSRMRMMLKMMMLRMWRMMLWMTSAAFFLSPSFHRKANLDRFFSRWRILHRKHFSVQCKRDGASYMKLKVFEWRRRLKDG